MPIEVVELSGDRDSAESNFVSWPHTSVASLDLAKTPIRLDNLQKELWVMILLRLLKFLTAFLLVSPFTTQAAINHLTEKI